jgi:hypothetical protein
MGVGSRRGDGLAALVGVAGWPASSPQARAIVPRRREISRRGQVRSINGLQFALDVVRPNYGVGGRFCQRAQRLECVPRSVL